MNDTTKLLQQLVGEDTELWAILTQTGNALHRVRDKELRETGTSFEQLAIIAIIMISGHNTTPSRISRWLVRSPNAVSGILSRMEKQGLVTRIRDLQRKNLVRVQVTEKGQRMFAQVSQPQSVNRVLFSLSPEERQHLRSLLHKLRDAALDSLEIKKPPFPPPPR